MKSIRQNKDWPITHESVEIVNAHGNPDLDTNHYNYQMIQAGGKIIKGTEGYHIYNRYLLKCSAKTAKFLTSIDWYRWAFIGHYHNGRPTPELIIYELNTDKNGTKEVR